MNPRSVYFPVQRKGQSGLFQSHFIRRALYWYQIFHVQSNENHTYVKRRGFVLGIELVSKSFKQVMLFVGVKF